MQKEQRHLRVEEFANRSGYSIATIRKKISRREIGYRKIGRIVAIPESELTRILGEYRPPVGAGQ
jgi:excisionase family DNA binding protein